MDLQTAMDLGREAFWMVLIVSGPVMAMGLVVGLVVSLFQAITQIQEQTLTFVPKILAMAVAAVVFVPWIASELVEYTERLLGHLPF